MSTQRPRTCQARQQSDQMRCARCGLLWDTNDPEPPACPQPVPPDLPGDGPIYEAFSRHANPQAHDAAMAEIRSILKPRTT